MPPRNKKTASPWHVCERCGVLLTMKDLQLHLDNDCLVDKGGSIIHGLIKDGVIVNMLEEFQVEDGMKYIPSSEGAHCIFLSESAMQLCEMVIGGQVIIRYHTGAAVRTSWPMYERTLTTVLMTGEGMELLDLKPGSRVSVEKLNVCPLPTASVMIEPVKPSDWNSFTVDVLSSFSKMFVGKVVVEGNKLLARHYGQRIWFRVSKCFVEDHAVVDRGGVDENSTVIQQMGELKIMNSSKTIPYLLCLGTTFKLLKQSGESRKITKLSSVGGLDGIITKLKEFLDMIWNPAYNSTGIDSGHGCLLFGPPGTGKTLLVKALAAEYPVTFIQILGSEVYSKYVGEAEAKLCSYFAMAQERSPCLVFIDEIDALCPHNPDGSSSSSRLQELRITTTLVSLLDSLKEEGSGVVVIGATSRLSSLDARLRRPGRLDIELELPVPGPSQRLDILQKLTGLWQRGGRLELESGLVGLEWAAAVTHGHVGADLANVCSHAVTSALRRTPGKAAVVVKDQDWSLACTQVKPSAMREVMVEVPNVRWSDIGGQHDLKLKLKQAVEWPLHHPEAFQHLGISPPKGLLMFGPPGCSKTMIAKALATESRLNFISIKGPELFSKWVGESERAVREVFRRARQVAPAVVFFDELDALGGERGSKESSGGASVQERVLAQLLTEMDGIMPLSSVTVVAATNRPDRIDKALLRPGRLDQMVYVPLPDANTRKDILTKRFEKSRFSKEVSLDELIEKTQGYSGAEVVAVCHEAGLNALEEDIQAECIHTRHIEKALRNVKPRTPQYLLKLYEKYAN